MDDSFDDMEDNIRPPDVTKIERLIEDTRCDFEKEMDNALNESMKDIEEQQKIQDNYEKELLDKFLNESIKRRHQFEKLLFDLNKLIKYDKEIKEIYELIEPIIELYCNQYIEFINFDQTTHEKIFNILNKIRIDKTALDILKNIILIE
jgi:hypothetical protein